MKRTIKRTISIKLHTTQEQSDALTAVQREFNRACNLLVPIALKTGDYNQVALHHRAYYRLGLATTLHSQMRCNAIKVVSHAFTTAKNKKRKKEKKSSPISFKARASVHYDKRTYTIKDDGSLSLYTLSGRIVVPMILGPFQKEHLQKGKPKEAQLVYKHNTWYFNLVLDMPNVPLTSPGNILGVDLGENVLAATSSGTLFKGNKLRDYSDRKLAVRRRLQSNGTKSAKQRLKKISGKEARHKKHVNHQISNAIVQEALATGCSVIVLEDLTHIGDTIKGTKRIRIRLHRWSWKQLQNFIAYKAQAVGIQVIFVNPAYTSQVCSECGCKGERNKHRFRCKICGIQRHSDLNASRNLRRIVLSADGTTGTVNCPDVEAA